jgi:hypothetical protein
MDQLQSEVRRLSERWTKFSEIKQSPVFIDPPRPRRPRRPPPRPRLQSSPAEPPPSRRSPSATLSSSSTVSRRSPTPSSSASFATPPRFPPSPTPTAISPSPCPTSSPAAASSPSCSTSALPPQNLASALRPLLDDTPARAQMIADLAEARAQVSCPPPIPTPSSVSATPPKFFCARLPPAAYPEPPWQTSNYMGLNETAAWLLRPISKARRPNLFAWLYDCIYG